MLAAGSLVLALGVGLAGLSMWPVTDAVSLLCATVAAAVAAWFAASLTVRKGFVGHGSYVFAWGCYAVVGTIGWAIIWHALPVLRFWAPLQCTQWDGPDVTCSVADYVSSELFWVGLSVMLIFIPHSFLSALVFVLRLLFPKVRPRIEA